MNYGFVKLPTQPLDIKATVLSNRAHYFWIWKTTVLANRDIHYVIHVYPTKSFVCYDYEHLFKRQFPTTDRSCYEQSFWTRFEFKP